MRRTARWTLLPFFWFFATQGLAQPVGCGADHVCIDKAPVTSTAEPTSLSAGSQANVAQSERCLEAPIDVTAITAEERLLACSAAYHTIQLLSRCNIPVHRTLNMEILDRVRHPVHKELVFGFFDPKRERVFITREAGISSLSWQTPYAEVPSRDLYRSLIVHELVHAIMHQNLKRPAQSHAAYEYPAYAIQLASMPAEVLQKLLRAVPNRAIRGETIFNDSILFFDPFFFAVNAYEHFHKAASACARLNALLDVEGPFVPALASE